MLKRILTVSAALVLMTGFAGVAHADRITVINNFSANPLEVDAIGRSSNPWLAPEKVFRIQVEKGQKRKVINLGEDYRLWSMAFFLDDIGVHGNWVRNKPKATDPERAWKVTISPDKHGSGMIIHHESEM